jgi:hypothetical protein
MSFFHLDRVLEFFASLQLVMGMVWLGLAAFTVCLAILMYSRWGQSRPLRKCMALSLLFHLMLAGYCTTIEIITPGPPASESTFYVSFQDDSPANNSEREVSGGAFVAKGVEQPWERFPSDDVAQPVPSKLDRHASDIVMEPERSVQADETQLADEPVLNRAALVAVKPAEPKSLPSERLAERVSERQVERSAAAESASPIEAPAAQRREASEPTLESVALSKQDEMASRATQPARVSSENIPSALTQSLGTLPKVGANANVPDSSNAMAALTNPMRAEPPVLRSGGRVTESAIEQDPAYGTANDNGMASTEHSSVSTQNGETHEVQLSKLSLASVSGMSNQATGDPNSPGGGVSGHAIQDGATPNADRTPDGNANGAENVIPDAYRLRMIPNHADAATHRGCSAETEAAVRAALKWFAGNQSADGRWNPRDFGAGKEMNLLGHSHQNAGSKADTGVTGLVLLAFLASGNTHRDGVYQENVRRGLNYLLQMQGQDGNLGGQAALFEFMYCHAMATCALSEAYGMTHDARLRSPVERAIAFTISSQDPVGGGWRYKAGMAGDTSQMGWQLMALKSADMAGIPIPESTRQGVIRYLRSVSSGKHGGRASYRPGEQVSRVMSAEALVCWEFLGLPSEHPACGEASELLLGELPGAGLCNLYYWYYATLGMYQLQGDSWERWNDALRKTLITRQVQEGQMAGSWEGDDLWGCHGGRLYTTALATLTLEVYYRFLPLYSGVSTAKDPGSVRNQVK